MSNREITPIDPFASPNTRTITGNSNSPYLRKRRTNVQVRKSNQELIMEAHQQLLDYVDNIDQQVGRVVKGYEAQFLEAYRRHFLKVRDEMKQIGKNTQSALEDNKQYVLKIQALEKNLVLFRQESLMLSEKNNKLQQQIKNLKFQIKDLQQQKQKISDELSKALKENKETAVLIQNLNKQSEISQPHLISKPSQITSPATILPEQRTPSMSYRNSKRRIIIGLQSLKQKAGNSLKKEETPQQNYKKEEISKQLYKTVDCRQQNQMRSEHYSQRRNTAEKFTKSRTNTHKLIRQEVKRMRSQQLMEKNQYQRIFAQCVQEVRKQILRRNKMVGLNFFKNKGPMDLSQFKRIDYHLLLYIFLNNQKILQTFYNLMFREEPI